MKLLADNELNMLRGRALTGTITKDEVLSLFGHLDALEMRLVEADYQDVFGEKGWRQWVGLPGADKRLM
jgi:hypothetical protein